MKIMANESGEELNKLLILTHRLENWEMTDPKSIADALNNYFCQHRK